MKAQNGGRSIDIPQHCNGGWSTPRPGTQMLVGLEVCLAG